MALTRYRYCEIPADEGEPLVEDPRGDYVRLEDVLMLVEGHRKKWDDSDHWDHEDALAGLLRELRAEDAAENGMGC